MTSRFRCSRSWAHSGWSLCGYGAKAPARINRTIKRPFFISFLSTALAKSPFPSREISISSALRAFAISIGAGPRIKLTRRRRGFPCALSIRMYYLPRQTQVVLHAFPVEGFSVPSRFVNLESGNGNLDVPFCFTKSVILSYNAVAISIVLYCLKLLCANALHNLCDSCVSAFTEKDSMQC